MTIKSIGRKDTNFNQLITYLHQHDREQQEGFTFLHNIWVAPDNLDGIEQAFKTNNTYRRKRTNGIGQYHEVMSFHPDDAPYIKEHTELLEDMARVYLELRAPHAIALARPHIDTKHIHLHFMISPNEQGSKQNIRLTKKQFQALRRTMEEYQLKYYPDLKHSYVHSRDSKRYETEKALFTTKSHKVWQMNERGMDTEEKNYVKNRVGELLQQARDEQSLFQLAEQEQMEVYRYRGKLTGVIFNGRKYRFRRLLGKEHEGVNKVGEWNKNLKMYDNSRERTQLEQGF